ncbi:MAG: sigma-54-dependent Fis family transcriptional regulator [Candidatus Eiseniibacteriota bacterium]|nr:MAG: sigma-54-dependent Fis family transcriptional regulator [Candidatus Eisenbacteria bacterium]
MANVGKLQELGKGTVLIVDDDKSFSWSLCEALKDAGYNALASSSSRECMSKISETPIDVVLLDLKLGAEDGVSVLKRIRKDFPEVAVIMITAYGDIPQAVECMRSGAFNFITKTAHRESQTFFATVGNAIESSLSRRRDRLHKQELRRFYDTEEIVGRSEGMLELMKKAQRVAESPSSTVLIMGETGVGKELLARFIHDKSPNSEGPFVALNCSALPENLLESELFGYEKGAFTDARMLKKGLFEVADRGTLFLDEIADMHLRLQAKLLRAIESKSFRRVGGTQDISVNTRIIAATNKRLRIEAQEGRFRLDLFYRLSVVPLEVPPLRERREDIGPLMDHFVAHFNKELGKSVRGCSPDAMQRLLTYDWPGNVRELRNVMERAMLLETDDLVLPHHLVLEPVRRGVRAQESEGEEGAQYASSQAPHEGTESEVCSLAEAERRYILKALKLSNNNKTKAAQLLGISRQTLRTKLKEYAKERSDSSEASDAGEAEP